MKNIILFWSIILLLWGCEDTEYSPRNDDVIFKDDDCRIFWRGYIPINGFKSDPLEKLFIRCDVKDISITEEFEIVENRYGLLKYPFIETNNTDSLGRKILYMDYCQYRKVFTSYKEAKKNLEEFYKAHPEAKFNFTIREYSDC